MKQLILTLETVTPIFQGGANSDILSDEIRSPSIRGQLHYWLRTLLGLKYGADTKKLSEAEGKLLGDTQVGSPIQVQVRELDNKPLSREDRMLLPHRSDPKKTLEREAFIEENLFQLILSLRSGLKEIPNEVIASLLLWLNLGGLGKRARRGHGSLQICALDVSTGIPNEAKSLFEPKSENGTELAQQINKLVSWSIDTIGGETAKIGEPPAYPNYPILSKKFSNVMVCCHAFPNGDQPYEEAMKSFWTDKLRSNELRDEQAYGRVKGRRRSSPFHLHISKTSAGHHLVITTFWSKPSPGDNAEEGWHKVEKLLAACKKDWAGQVVWGKEIKHE